MLHRLLVFLYHSAICCSSSLPMFGGTICVIVLSGSTVSCVLKSFHGRSIRMWYTSRDLRFWCSLLSCRILSVYAAWIATTISDLMPGRQNTSENAVVRNVNLRSRSRSWPLVHFLSNHRSPTAQYAEIAKPHIDWLYIRSSTETLTLEGGEMAKTSALGYYTGGNSLHRLKFKRSTLVPFPDARKVRDRPHTCHWYSVRPTWASDSPRV